VDYATICAALGIDGSQSAEEASPRPADWAASQVARPSGPLWFLEPYYIRQASDEAELPADALDPLLAAAQRSAEHPAALALAWYCYYCLYRARHTAAWRRWPPLEGLLGRDADLFRLLVVLSNLPAMHALYRERAVPQAVIGDTLADIARWMRVHHETFGHWGVDASRANWLSHHLAGEVYHLGRLQYIVAPFEMPARFYRHQTAGTVLALSEDGVRYHADGRPVGTGGIKVPAGTWIAQCTDDGQEVRGYPILPAGTVVQREVRLSRQEWQPILKPGDPILDIHIPRGGPLDLDRCIDSLQEALAFFPRHFPDSPFVAFSCWSWILDPQLQAMLLDTSNLVRFQREFYVLPVPSEEDENLDFLFGLAPFNLQSAPRDTALRRAVLDHLLTGRHLYDGGGVLFPQDLQRGRQIYLRQQLQYVTD
jgi:hypothetical protein